MRAWNAQPVSSRAASCLACCCCSAASTRCLPATYGSDFRALRVRPRQNPLRLFGTVAGPIGLALLLAYVAWLAGSKRGRSLTDEASSFGLLAVALLANTLLWPAGLVACFPLTLLLAARSRRPVPWGLAMLAPFYLPLELVGAGRFTLWCLVVGLYLWFERTRPDQPLSEPAAAVHLS